MTGRERMPGSQLNVDNAGKRWCMMIWQWPSEIPLVWSSGRSAINIPARVIPVLVERFTSAGFIYLCHSTRSVNTWRWTGDPPPGPGPVEGQIHELWWRQHSGPRGRSLWSILTQERSERR